MYGYCQEKIEVCHYWDLKGYCRCSFNPSFSLFQVFRYTCSRAWRSDDRERVNPSIFFFMNFLLRSTKCFEQATHLFCCFSPLHYPLPGMHAVFAPVFHNLSTSLSQHLSHIVVSRPCYQPAQQAFPLKFVETLATQATMLHVFVQIILPQKGLGISRDSIGACFRKIIFIIHVMQVSVKRYLTV